MYELELREVGKKYKEKTAIGDFSYIFRKGVYGLLGENGAGKTTLMRLICGILQPTHGMVRCDGIDILRMGADYRGLLGYLPQDFGYYGDFTAERFLNYMAALKALPSSGAKLKIQELLELTGLSEMRKRKLKTFSGGMLRRLGIAQALLNEPEILVLDEPTAGLDPKERVNFRNIISALGKDRMVLLSTHIVSDIEYIADTILIMKDGSLILSGTSDELVKAAKGHVWSCDVCAEDIERMREMYIVSNIRNCEGGAKLRIVADEMPAKGTAAAEPTLEEAYLYHGFLK